MEKLLFSIFVIMVQESQDVLKNLQSETDKIKSELDALKKLAESKEKAQKKQELYQSIQEIQELAKEQFEKETDQNVKSKIAEVQSQVSNCSKELQNLENNVSQAKDETDQNDQISPVVVSADATENVEQNSENLDQNTNPSQNAQEKKEGTWQSIKKFTGEQRDSMLSKETWQKEPGKNILRTAGFVATGVGAVTLVYKGFQWLFGGDEKEETEGENSEESASKKKKKSGFWNSWFGKALKWGGITAGSVRGISKLWSWFNGSAEPSRESSGSDKYHGYEQFSKEPNNREKVENYEAFGENIDVLYSIFYQKELDAGYQDELEMLRISNEMKKTNPDAKNYKGIIPFCLDNQYGSVSNILAQNTAFKSLFGEGFSKMKNHILSWSTEKLGVLVESFFSKLPSWKLVENIEGSIVDKIKAWGENSEEAQHELKYFFRQGIRVQTFLFEKTEQLVDAIAEKKSKTLNISKEELLDNEEYFEQHILKDPDYQAFVDAPISTAVTVLKKYQLDSANVSQELKDEVQKLDQRRDKLLDVKGGNADILQIAYHKKTGETFTQEEKEKLASACENVAQDIDDELIDAVEESAYAIYGDLFATEDSRLREYIQKSGLNEILCGAQQFLLQQKERLKSGEQVSPEDLKATAQVVNDLLALKKECFLGQLTIEKDIDENGNIIYRIPGFLLGSVQNLWKSLKQVYNGQYLSGFNTFFSSLLGTGILISTAGLVLGKKKLTLTGVKVAMMPVSVPYFIGKKFLNGTAAGSRLRNKMIYGSPSWVQSNLLFRGSEGEEKLMKALEDGDLSLKKVERILLRKQASPLLDVDKKASWLKQFGIEKTTKPEDYLSHIFDTYVTKKTGSSAYVQDLKNNHRNLYDDLVKYFDHSPDIREAVRTGVAADVLEIGVVDLKNGKTLDFKRIQQLLDTPEYKKLMQRTMNSKMTLEKQLKNASSEAEKTKLSKQMDSCDEFLAMLRTKSSSEVAQISQVLDLFGQGNTAGLSVPAIKKLKTLSLLENGVDANGKKLISDFDSFLKKFDVDVLKMLRNDLANNKIVLADVTDQDLKVLINAFTDIKDNAAKNLIKNIDEFASCVKSLFKFAAKIS